MLALPPLKASNAEDREAAGGFSVDAFLSNDDCFLDSIDFSGIFEGFDFAGDLLPELEIPEPHVGGLSKSSAEGREEQELGSPESLENTEKLTRLKDAPPMTPESLENTEKLTRLTPAPPMTPENGRATAKISHGKKKMKVDWTPELHRRFVMAVEELGVDKAVPSRILEIMGNHNLTRHNVASHLQKYRSHRKHSLAREAEAGSWSHRRHIYGVAAATGGSACNHTKNKERCHWVAPTVGFPPPVVHQPQFGPLHVWGHPTVDRPTLMRAMWQGHAVPFQCPQPPWPQPQNYVAYWRPHFHGGSGEGWGPTAVTPAPRYMPQPLPGMRHAPSLRPVAGVPHHPVYRQHYFLPSLSQHHPQQDVHPSKESIDEAIGDVLENPWLPLPLGLKPPSTESVLGELQRQGVPKVPPPSCNNLKVN